jgi:hypothetical protein
MRAVVRLSIVPRVPFFTLNSRSFFRNMIRSPDAKLRDPRSVPMAISSPS